MGDRLQSEIRKIQRDASLSSEEKAKAIGDAMRRASTSMLVSLDTEAPVRDEITYHNEEKGILGCPHYERRIKMISACCDRAYTCRLCHNEAEEHKIDRHATKKMICMVCLTEQAMSNRCVNEVCMYHEHDLSRYYCDICKLHNDKEIDIYHCDDCGICRVGKGLGIDRYHCNNCPMGCVVINPSLNIYHECISCDFEKVETCVVCFEGLDDTRDQVIYAPCAHPMHGKCFATYIDNHQYSCPVCRKCILVDDDIASISELIREEIRVNPMPAAYQHTKTKILCNDCGQRATVPFHFCGHICSCGGFNVSIEGYLNMPQFDGEGNQLHE